MTGIMMRREESEFLKLTVVVSAIMTAAKGIMTGESGDGLQKALQNYRSSVFPEIQSDLMDKAQQNLKILQEEFNKGPLYVQSLQYSRKGKKRGG